MKKLGSKLNLSRETVARLDPSDLGRGVGGIVTVGCAPSAHLYQCVPPTQVPGCQVSNE